MNALSAGGIAARFGAALVLILATYNPEGRSYFDWVEPRLPEFDALRAFVGIVLLIGWTVFLRASTRSLGVLGRAEEAGRIRDEAGDVFAGDPAALAQIAAAARDAGLAP